MSGTMTKILREYWNTMFLSVTTYPWSRNSLGGVGLFLVLLSIGFLGLRVILAILFSLVALVLGLCFRFYSDSETESTKTVERIRRVSLVNVKNVTEKKSDSPIPPSPTREPRQKMDMRITGSALIDETIHEMIDYILRDYIHAWHDFITEDDEFVHELRLTIQETLVTLSSRIKEIDWIPYITTHLVDDAASHLRLFRQSTAKVKENPTNDLISVFFDMEASMEKNLCRDMVCTDDSHLNDYFQGLIEGLLYLLLPQETYGCTPVGSLAQDLLANHVLIPLLDLISDPDFVNQSIVWLCQDFSVTPDIFMFLIRTCDTMDELSATQKFFEDQLQQVKESMHKASRDDANPIKQQIRCLNYVRKTILTQLSFLKEGPNGAGWSDEPDSEDWQHYFMTGLKLHTLTLEEVIKNSIALSYFLDYMSSVGGNHYLLMYLNADAWRVSAEQQLMEIEASIRNPQHGKDQNKSNQEMLDCMRDAAFNVYEQFLSEKAAPRVKLPENVTRKFYIQVRTEAITADLFDQIQEAIVETLQSTEKFYPGFTRNKLYIKCLMELDLLKAETVSAHSQSSASDEEDEDCLDGVVHVNNDGEVDHESKSFKGQVTEQLNELQTCRECLKQKKQISGIPSEELLSWEKDAWENKYKLRAEIIEVALTVEKGNTFGIYVVKATRQGESGVKAAQEKEWHIYRRYSDFYDFHHWIKSKWIRLSKLEFPSKQTFGKTDRIFLEKRMAALNKYFKSILTLTLEPYFGESLQDTLLHFLEPGNYVPKRKQLSEKIDSLVVNPLKQSVKNVTHAVKTMPDTLFNTVDGFTTGFTKIFQTRNDVADFTESMKVGASIDTEADDNIPLRIILLLMDEVFDLKSRNQWLRRRIVVIIRQVIKTMMGDNLNRRIVDYVAYITSPERVSGYLRNLQLTLWPGGRKISTSAKRDSNTKMRTRIAAKASLLSSLSDELKHLIGSETTRRGLLCVFDMCQNQVLNRRFLLVLVEGILKTLYADKPFPSLIQRLHFRSSRVGKYRPFIVPTNPLYGTTNSLKTSTMPMANLSPRGSRKRKP